MGCDISHHQRTGRVGSDRILGAPNPALTVTGETRVGWSSTSSERVGVAWASWSLLETSHAPNPSSWIPLGRSCCANWRLSREMPEFGRAGGPPGPALLGDHWRESFSLLTWGYFFICWKAGRARMVLGAGGSCWLWWGEEETPKKPSPSSARTRWNSSRSTCNLHFILFLPVPAWQGEAGLPLQQLCPSQGCSPVLPEPIPPS